MSLSEIEQELSRLLHHQYTEQEKRFVSEFFFVDMTMKRYSERLRDEALYHTEQNDEIKLYRKRHWDMRTLLFEYMCRDEYPNGLLETWKSNVYEFAKCVLYALKRKEEPLSQD